MNIERDTYDDSEADSASDNAINSILDKFKNFNNSDELVSKKLANFYKLLQSGKNDRDIIMSNFNNLEIHLLTVSTDRVDDYYDKATKRIDKMIKTLSVRKEKHISFIIVLEEIKRLLKDDDTILTSFGLDFLNYIWDRI